MDDLKDSENVKEAKEKFGNMTDETKAKVGGMVDDVKKAINDAKEIISETRNGLTKKALEAIEEARANENVKKMRDKLWGTVNDLKESDAAKEAKAFVEDVSENVDDLVDDAQDRVEEVEENLRKSGFFKKLKSLFGGK